MESDIVASVLAAAASSAAAEVVTKVVAPVSYALQEAVLQTSLANTGDVVGAVLASWDDRDVPAAESSDSHEDAHEDVGDGGDANRRPRARRRVDPLALLDVQPLSTGASGADMTAAVEKLKTEVDVLKRRAERFGTKVHKSKIVSVLACWQALNSCDVLYTGTHCFWMIKYFCELYVDDPFTRWPALLSRAA